MKNALYFLLIYWDFSIFPSWRIPLPSASWRDSSFWRKKGRLFVEKCLFSSFCYKNNKFFSKGFGRLKKTTDLSPFLLSRKRGSDFFFCAKIAPPNFNNAGLLSKNDIQPLDFTLFSKHPKWIVPEKPFVKSPRVLVIILQFQTTCW